MSNLRMLYATVHFIDEVKPSNYRLSISKKRIEYTQELGVWLGSRRVKRQYLPDYSRTRFVWSLQPVRP